MIFFYTTPLFKNYISEARKYLNSWARLDKPYLIYGAGEHSRYLSGELSLTATSFLGFIDQSELKQREGFLGQRVFSLSDALKLNPAAILVSSYEHQEEIVEEILRRAPDVSAPRLYNKPKPTQKKKRPEAPPLSRVKLVGKGGGKRIAVIDTFFSWPPIGGSSVDLSELMNSLAFAGYEVTFFLPYLKDRLYFPRGRIFSGDSLKFNIKNIVFSQDEFREETFINRVGEAVDEWQPDYVFLGDMYAFKPSLLLRLKQYKTILRSYNYDLICPRMTLLNDRGLTCPHSYLETPEICRECIGYDNSLDWNHPIFRELRLADLFSDSYHKKSLRAIDEAGSIIVYNSVLKERIERVIREPEKIRVFPTGIFPDFFLKRSKGESDADSKRVEEITILLPGRAGDPVKGFPFYLEVFQKLKESYKNIRLLITCKFDPGIDGVRSAGWLPLEEARKLYREADFCVIPSLWEEPFGIVALEAMASGIPVIASSVGGLKGIVKEGKTGFLATPGDYEAFFKLSETLILYAGLRDSLGRAGVREAQKYSWPKIVSRYLSEVFN